MTATHNVGDIVQRIEERLGSQTITVEITPRSGINECLIRSRETGVWHDIGQLSLSGSLKPDWSLNQLRTYKIPYDISEVQEVNGRYSVTLSPK